jgi:hypothetical protein
MKSIRTKPSENNATITRADKGNSLVILPTPQYDLKIEKFLNDNSFHTIATDPTKTFQNQVRRRQENSSKTLIHKDSLWRYTIMNPSAPSIKGLIKIYKQDQPIRPAVNWHKAPAYNLARLFNKKINQLTPLPHAFNIRNTQDLIHNLKETPTLPHYTLASLDIINLYSNIPVAETKTILIDMLTQEHTEP